MGNEYTKPSDRLKFIDREVNSLRSSVRSSRRNIAKETKDAYIESLAKFASEASTLKGKVKQNRLDQIQKNISNTMNEILTKFPHESDLDLGAVETSSFVQLPINKRQSSNKSISERSTKAQKSSQVDSGKSNFSTLQDIEEKFKTLRPQINVAIENKDNMQLRVHQETIKVLATDLDEIEVLADTPIGDRKKKLYSAINIQYQKINKARKDIRRNMDINYLAKQNKKEKASNELHEIKNRLDSCDSALKLSIRNNDSSSLRHIQDDLAVINQQLSSIDITDENTKRIKMELMDKITWFYKCINDTSQNNSNSDLSKAQSNYEDIIKNIANGKEQDKDDIKVKLESLQSFINNIKENDENSLRRKQQLLNNVKQSFSFILEDEPKIQNNSTDTNPKKASTIHKEVDNFYNTWKSVQKDIKSMAYSNEECSKIDKALEDIQKSIAQTRQQITGNTTLESKDIQKSVAQTRHHITGNTDLETNLKKTLNYSSPNLSSSKLIDPKFGSSLSVDHTGRALIKTRAKVYNLSTPEIQNINDQPVVLRNKQFYRSNIEIDDDNRFSKIEEIKTQVNYIKEKFQESQQKQHLKNKLESYVTILEHYVHHKNQKTANNAKIVLADIQEMLKSMSHIQEAMNIIQQRRMSIEDSFENIVGIQEAVEKLHTDVTKFSGEKGGQEYMKIKRELSDCRNILQEIKISPKYDMIQQQKEGILKEINTLFETLESKCDHCNDPHVINTRKNLDNLKEKVKRFSGAYRGVLYNTIEKNLKKLLMDITETIENKEIADEIMQDAEKHLKILEHRATKDQSFRRTISDARSTNEDDEKLIKLNTELQNIKTAIDTTPANGVNLFLSLKGRLDLVKLGLDQLKFSAEDEEKQKDIFYNEVETLKNSVEAKIALGKQALRQWPIEQDQSRQFEAELSKIEEKFKSLKPEIENFVGTTSDNKFYELDETSIRLVLKMDKFQFSTGSEAHNRKINLLKEIYSYGDLLDQRAKETEELVDIEREIHDIEKNFERYVRLNDLENLESKVNALRTKINNAELNKNLLERKQTCVNGIERILENIICIIDRANKEIQKDSRRNSSKITEDEISNIELQFRSIKKEVDTFVGIHADKKYYELDGSMSGLSSKLDSFHVFEGSDSCTRKNNLLKEIHACRNILDKKAKDTEIVREISKQLNAINSKVDKYKGSNEELKVLENELKSVHSKMGQYKASVGEKTAMKQKYDILFEEYSRLKKAKEVPKESYIGSTSFLADVNNLNKNKIPQNIQGSIETQIADIQMDIDKMRGRVAVFVNSDTSEEYKKLEEILLLLQVRLNKLEIPENSEFYGKQLALQKNVQECLEVLDERAQEANSIMEIEKELEELRKTFDNIITEEDRNVIDEKLISLQVKLGKLHLNDDLSERKYMCVNRIIIYLKHLKEKQISKQKSNLENQLSGNIT